MKPVLTIVVALGLALTSVSARALPVGTGRSAVQPPSSTPYMLASSSWGERVSGKQRHARRTRVPAAEPDYAPNTYGAQGAPATSDEGGYVVNQYGFGNYVGGSGGFAGYPAGSAGAQIHRQQEEWKCVAVPETC